MDLMRKTLTKKKKKEKKGTFQLPVCTLSSTQSVLQSGRKQMKPEHQSDFSRACSPQPQEAHPEEDSDWSFSMFLNGKRCQTQNIIKNT